ncbi:hypothetical protein IV203_026131 [Nitzschia inconspicua]|uniref:Uncharacterized protein n=1 Tax=Nitzschia inconspicua TaxID=303405 RepID=A0A9K3PX99_9STRA|nr:hypothetical protein IV203_026131 [Nitzschia inconspicua]
MSEFGNDFLIFHSARGVGGDGVKLQRLVSPDSSVQKRFTSSLPEVFDYKVPSRNRTLALMRLNVAAYPTCQVRIQHGHECSYPEDIMEAIFRDGLSIFGPNITNMDGEIDATQLLYEVIWNESVVQGSSSHRKISVPQETAEFEVGVQALEWTLNDTTVLAFRGTFTDGDYANTENWITDFILEKSTDRMEQAWVKDSGLRWTSEMEERAKASDRWAKLEIRAGESYILGRKRPLKDGFRRKQSIMEELVNTVARNETLSNAIGGFTVKDAEATGYWKLTKFIVDEAARRARENNRTLVLTGHSQGGTRAQLASMYLYKTTGISHPTVTFAATGGACASRLLFYSNADLLNDVDPFVRHENMVEYVHPLDPWGNSMLGMDNGDQVCHWGKLDAQAAENSGRSVQLGVNDGAYYYCSKVYGWPWPYIIAAQSGLSRDNELRSDFQRCRYFTHMAESILFGLERNLLEDGTTDGGCYKLPEITQTDPDQRCPTGRLSRDEDHAVEGLVFVATMLVAGCVMMKGSCGTRCVSKHRYYDVRHTVVPSEEDTTSDWNDEDPSTLELPEIP